MIGSEIIGRDGINQNPYHPAVDQPKVLRLRQYTNIKQIFLMSLIPGKIYQKLRSEYFNFYKSCHPNWQLF